MASDFGIEFTGLKVALGELNQIDKKLRRQITKDFKAIVQPVVAKAQTDLPTGAPLSGMARSWKTKSGADIMSWQDARVKRNIKAFTNAKKVRQSPSGNLQNVGVFGVRWAGPQATIFDMARQGLLSQNLTARFGPPSRVIYKAYESARNEVEVQVQQLVNRVMQLTGRDGRL
jgi:hypothetical protein